MFERFLLTDHTRGFRNVIRGQAAIVPPLADARRVIFNLMLLGAWGDKLKKHNVSSPVHGGHDSILPLVSAWVELAVHLAHGDAFWVKLVDYHFFVPEALFANTRRA